jgi:dTDP-4-dehydrorhamnose reductase
MRILVTGVTGQVGGALNGSLARTDFVYAADRGEIDLSQPGEIAATLDRIRPDLLINAAAYTAVDRAEDEKELAYRVNAEAPGTMAKWATRDGIPFIHFSTDYVFDGTSSRPWREDDRPNPLSIYGASKLAGEEAIRAAGGPHLIIRTEWVYAASGKNFLRTIARLAAERKELRIVADQYGAPSSASLLADVVAAIVRPDSIPLAQRFAAAGGLINVAASGATTWHGFAVAIVEGLKNRGVSLAVESIVPIATSEYPTKAKRPANSRLDLARLKEVFAIETPDWVELSAAELDLVARGLLGSAKSVGAPARAMRQGENRKKRL